MTPRHALLMTVLTICSAAAALGAGPLEQFAIPDKEFVTDGHVVHNLGRLHNHVTNWGLIGSHPGTGTPYSAAPSARWPGETGIDYLWGAGLWVGGEVLGEPRVSTGQFSTELMPGDAPGDSIYGTQHGAPGGNRYPWDGADDDSDGSEDEDPLDGLDNDGDGLIDEDFAAISDQDFHCTMTDNTALSQQVYPDHVPLNIRVTQRSFQWDGPLAADFIGYDFTITNIGDLPIENLRCGLFSDFDIGDPSDDLAGGYHGGLIRASDGSFVPVEIGYMHDGAPNSAYGWAGWVACGMSYIDYEDGMDWIYSMQDHSMQIFAGQSAFDQGGDPTNDEERYRALSAGNWDANPPAHRTDDYRILLSAPVLAVLAPDESITFRVALVLGSDLNELLTNASEAVLTAVGRFYDRDGDPTNGYECHVPWIAPGDIPVAALAGELLAARTDAAVELEFDLRNTDGLTASVVRRATARADERRWRDLATTGLVIDDDDVGWPRTYDLVVEIDGADDLVLDSIEVTGPVARALALTAAPNPFNPRVTLSFTLAEPATATLTIHDVRGHKVRTLLPDTRVSGPVRVEWDGTDAAGQAVASGVYIARLVAGQKIVEQRVSLVR